MLIDYLLRTRATSGETDLAFRTRGEAVSRIEGFSDAVFGFAITLLVISSKAPDTSVELLAMSHAVLPFVASFFVLFLIWRAQFDFFRRYGLEDRHTVRLTGILLMIVLLAVYPLKFLFTFIFDVFPAALIAGNDSMRATMPLAHVPRVMMLYAIGYGGVAFVFSRLYHHAATQHAALELSTLELFDTRAIQRRWLGMVMVNVAVIAVCGILIWVGDHFGRRDSTYEVVNLLGVVGVWGMGVLQLRSRRRLARERLALTAVPHGELPSLAGAD